MQVLTPSGYQSPGTLANGAEVCAFDSETGAPIINHVENIDAVDYAEWCRWWQIEESVPAFNWIRINGAFLLFGEQSIWRNGTNVCHVKHLIVGDEIYDDADHPVGITSIEVVEDNSLIWYRFDIDGDHSYIIDGLTVHNASRFWVGGTGTWDASTTTHWAASAGGAGDQSVPGSADTVTIDSNLSGGTLTLNYGGAITVQWIGCGSMVGTFDNSVNNNNITMSSTTGFNTSGSGTRTVNLGTATYTLTSGSANWTFSSAFNLTYLGSSANVVFSGATGTCIFNGGGFSHGNVTLGPTSGSGVYSIRGSNTIASLSISPPNYIQITTTVTNTITAPLNWAGTSTSLIVIESDVLSVSANTIAAAAGSSVIWCAFSNLIFTGSPVASNSFNLAKTSGITITPPGGGGSFGVVGS